MEFVKYSYLLVYLFFYKLLFIVEKSLWKIVKCFYNIIVSKFYEIGISEFRLNDLSSFVYNNLKRKLICITRYLYYCHNVRITIICLTFIIFISVKMLN
jgi:hypothetical protein